MKLLKFIGKEIHNYLNFDISFKEPVTFLIGINGAGKTTVLRLIRSLLYCNVYDLLSVEFASFEIVFDMDGKQNRYSCHKGKGRITFSCDGCGDNVYEIPENVKDGIKGNIRSSYMSEAMDFFADKIKSGTVYQQIQKMKLPLILGLDRKVVIDDKERDNYPMAISRMRRLHETNDLDKAIDNVLEEFHLHSRIIAKQQSDLADKFKKDILKANFKERKWSAIKMDVEYFKAQQSDLSSRKEKLFGVINDLDISDVKTEIEHFFDQMQENLTIILQEKGNTQESKARQLSAIVEWYTRSAQLEYFDEVAEYGEKYNEEKNKLNKRINRFTESVNKFLGESDKEVYVNNMGSIRVRVKNKPKIVQTVFELSSGEKQLIIMLGHLAFMEKNKMMNVCIIDEPELSLHIAWQDVFVDAIMEANPDTQFIIATHSPNIISKNERREWCVDLSISK